MTSSTPSEIQSLEQLRETLKQSLGYCTCSSQEALLLLREFLELAQQRSEATADLAAFKTATAGLENLLEGDGATALADWFVYSLDRGGLISHGFNLYDVWISDAGRRVLTALQRFVPARETE